MGLKKVLKRSSKAQLMTIIMLILFMLILVELFTLSLLNITSDQTMQLFSLSFASSNYGNLFRLSANNFAKESLSRAISSLATYEYTPSLRKGNLISNTTLYISNMIISGILPNDTSGYPENAMGNLTLTAYNNSIVSLFNFAAQPVKVNETTPIIFQLDPYHIGVSYTERISINSSGSNYRYNIPVNVSISINNTPDLLYAQQGVLRNIKFANLTNVTSVIGGAYAASGNAITYAYGTVYSISSSSTSGASCAQVSAAPFNTIIATYNAINLGGCINGYAGLITYIAPPTPPTVPYLVYSSSTNILQSLPTGQKVLVYGPGFETLNIEGLRTAIMNGYYFSSPFTPSYLNTAQDNFNMQSPNGIFTFSNYNTQTANFNGQNGYINLGNNPNIARQPPITISFWVSSTAPSTGIQLMLGDWINFGAQNYGFFWSDTGGAGAGQIEMLAGGIEASTSNIYTNGAWTHIVGTDNGITSTFYINGAPVGSAAHNSISNLANNWYIGAGNGQWYFPGEISNVQIYSTALAAVQIKQLYQEGISGLPISGNALAAWYPLNGNANDYSGNSNNGVATAVSYSLPQNYSRDSILNTPVPTALSPVPGILSCTSSSICRNNLIPQLYLGYMPLEIQNGYIEAANFNGQNSNINMGNNVAGASSMTISLWANPSFAPSGGSSLVSKASGYDSYDTDYYLFWWGSSTSPQGVQFGASDGSSLAYVNLGDTNFILNNQWQHIVIVKSGTSANAYRNGALYGTGNLGAAGVQNHAVPLQIGDEIYNRDFNGLISNVQIYDTALSANQVKQLYQEGIAGLPIISGNIVGWWPLNGDANDYSGFANPGVATNVAYPYLSGTTYNAPGLSSIAVTANEWQALGLANT